MLIRIITNKNNILDFTSDYVGETADTVIELNSHVYTKLTKLI